MSDQKNTQDLVTRLRALADADLTDYAGLNKEKVKQLRDGAREAADFLEGVAIGQNTLTDQIADLCKERDDLKAELAEAEKARECQAECADDAIRKMDAAIQGGIVALDRAEKAEAEAAALREAGNALVPFLPDISYGIAAKHSSHQQAVMAFKAALSQPGPGAAYQERADALAKAAEELLDTPDHPVDVNIAKAILADAISKYRGK